MATGSAISLPGPRAVEARLLDALVEEAEAARADPRRLLRPVLVVVPSGSLRRQLQARLATRLGAVLGVEVLTLGALTREVLRRAGRRRPAPAVVFDVLARRALAREEILAAVLDDLVDGYGFAAGSVRDLLSAGLGADEAEAIARLHRLPENPGRWRALATVRAAARTAGELERRGLAREGDLQALAAAAVSGARARCLPYRALHVHGFADATGKGRELLRALLDHGTARLWLDLPDDPVVPGSPDRGAAFARRFAASLGLAPQAASAPASLRAPESRAWFTAPGRAAEAREVAVRIRRLLDAGVRPESIAVVARHLEPHAVGLRRALRDAAIPFSGGAVPCTLQPARRRLDALLTLLDRAGRAPVDAWLDVLDSGGGRAVPGGTPGASPGSADLADLRLGLRILGLTRLEEVTVRTLRSRAGGTGPLPLPVRRGIDVDADEDAGRLVSRSLPATALEAAGAAAEALVARLAAWSSPGALAMHLGVVAAVARDLGLTGGTAAGRLLRETADDLAAAAGDDALDPSEARAILRQALRDRPHEDLGGRGGGVAVLGLAKARGLTFEHLFVIGVEGEDFPRRPGTDPFLDEAARAALGTLLPALPTSRDRAEEELHLFAQLQGAAPHLTLSRRRSDDEGAEVAPSPFWDRLAASGLWPEVEDVPQALGAHPSGGRGPVVVREAGILLALAGRRDALREPLAQTFAAALSPGGGVPDPEAVARARLAVLEESDPPPGSEGARAVRPGPWHGFLGPAGPGDPRNRKLFVTRLEALARCPWQMVLRHLLRIEELPDPETSLPGIDRLVLGNTVHEALEELVVTAIERPAESRLEALCRDDPIAMPRPKAEAVVDATRSAAPRVARAAGLHLPGLHRALAARALPLVRRAIAIDWPDEGAVVPVLGAECTGDVAVAGRRVHFRADRADVTVDGLRLTDYKTGRPPLSVKRADAIARHRERLLAEGRLLQGAAYAAFGEGSATGRYLFVDDARIADGAPHEIALTGDDDASQDRFRDVAGVLLGALAEGVLPPRFEVARGEAACTHCEVRAACLRDDSGYRRRLRALVESLREARPEAGALGTLGAVWWLGAEAPAEETS